MRSTLPRCARLLTFVLFGAACSLSAKSRDHGQTAVNVAANCSGNQVTLTVNPSTVRFKHTNIFHSPTDVDWTLNASSDVDNVTIKPDGEWPLEGTPPFPVNKAGPPYHGVGKPTQDKGHYRYSVTVVCPNGGPTAIFDPDIWVD